MLRPFLILAILFPLMTACGKKGTSIPKVLVGPKTPTPTADTGPLFPNQPSNPQLNPPAANPAPPAALSGSLGVFSTTMNFGNVTVGQSAVLSTHYFENNYNQPIVADFTATFNSSVLQVVSENCDGATIQPGARCNFTVRFQPDAVACVGYQIYLSYTAGNSATTLYSPIVQVSGCGTAAGPVLTGSVSVASTTMAFGNVVLGGAVYTTGFWFRNNHNVPIVGTIQGISTLQQQSYLNGDLCSNVSLQPGAYCNFSVTFAPTYGGSHYREIKLTYTPSGFETRDSPLIIMTGYGI